MTHTTLVLLSATLTIDDILVNLLVPADLLTGALLAASQMRVAHVDSSMPCLSSSRLLHVRLLLLKAGFNAS